jgi:hypothetical protein
MKVWGQKAYPLWLFYLTETETMELLSPLEKGPFVVFISGNLEE